jgi:hypothetical protein
VTSGDVVYAPSDAATAEAAVPSPAAASGSAKPQLSTAAEVVYLLGISSPIRAAFSVPLNLDLSPTEYSPRGDLPMLFSYIGFTLVLNLLALLAVIWLFNSRWRVSDTH